MDVGEFGGILSFFFRKKFCSTRQVLRGAVDACRHLGEESLYRKEKVGKKLAGSVKGAYLCSVKKNKSRKGQAKQTLIIYKYKQLNK